MANVKSQNDDLQSINARAALMDESELGKMYSAEEIQAMRDDPKRMAEAKRAAIARANLDVANGKVALVVAGEPAWTGLGVNMDGAFTSAEGLHYGGLDFWVELWASQVVSPHGVTITSDTAFHLVRTDTEAILTRQTVGKDYTVFQNVEAFALMDALVAEKLAMFHTAGAIDGGRVVWMQCKLPKRFTVGRKDDEQETFVLLTNGHGNRQALKLGATTLRAECANTLRLAIDASEGMLSIRHNTSLKGRVEQARNHLGIVLETVDEFEKTAKQLVRKKLTDEEAIGYWKGMFPTEIRPVEQDGADILHDMLNGDETGIGREIIEDMLYASSERQAKKNEEILGILLGNFDADSARGTAWGAYNAVSKREDHQATWRGEGETRLSARLKSSWFGTGDKIKQQAFAAAQSL